MRVDIVDSKLRILRVRPESEEDLWTLKLVLRKGDYVTLRTSRDVRVGSGKKERISMTLKIRLEGVEFQPFTGKLRITGVVVEGPDEFGVKGRRHSAAVSIGQQLVIEREGGWSRSVVERLKSSGSRGSAIVAAVDYDEYAIAVVAHYGFTVVEEADISLPGKDDPSRDDIVRRLVDRVARRIVEEASRRNSEVAVVAGPGPLKLEVAEKVRGMSPRMKVVVDDVSRGGRGGVEEALRRGRVAEALRHYSILEAEAIIEEFLRRIARSRERVAYTVDEVLALASMGAVEAVVVEEGLLYTLDDDVRVKVDAALDAVERMGGKVVIIPSDSPPAERLRGLGGVAALLRYAVPDEARRLSE